MIGYRNTKYYKKEKHTKKKQRSGANLARKTGMKKARFFCLNFILFLASFLFFFSSCFHHDFNRV